MRVADKIREADDITAVLVEVPEWGVTIEVRDTNLEERDRLSEAMSGLMIEDEDGERTMRPGSLIENHVELLSATCFDPETGERVFVTEEDKTLIRTKNATPTMRLVEAANELLGFAVGAVDEGKDDSSSTPTGDTDSS